MKVALVTGCFVIERAVDTSSCGPGGHTAGTGVMYLRKLKYPQKRNAQKKKKQRGTGLP